MDITTLIGFAAALCSMTSFVPQAWKIVRSRDASGVSARMYMLTATGFALWLAYGWIKGEWPLILTNSVCLALSGFILFMKLRRDREAKA